MRFYPKYGIVLLFFSTIFLPALAQNRKEKAFNDKIIALEKTIDELKAKVKRSTAATDSLNEIAKELEVKRKALNDCESRLSQKDPLADLQNAMVFDQAWAVRNLNEKEVRALISSIRYADNLEQWIEQSKNKQPAYCYHLEDTGRKFGVLLNIPALEAVQKALNEKAFVWKVPMKEDVDRLAAAFSKHQKFSPFQLIISSSAAPTKKNWKRAGIDFFGMNLVPLSFRLNDNRQWYGGDEASFFCADPSTIEVKERLSLCILDEGLQNFYLSTQDLTEEFNHYGVYVRLIKKQEKIK